MPDRTLMEAAMVFFDSGYLTLTERISLMKTFGSLDHPCMIKDVVPSTDDPRGEFWSIQALITDHNLSLPPRLAAHLLNSATDRQDRNLPKFVEAPDVFEVQTALGGLRLHYHVSDNLLSISGGLPIEVYLRVRSYPFCDKGAKADGQEIVVLPASTFHPHADHDVAIPEEHTALVTCSTVYGKDIRKL